MKTTILATLTLALGFASANAAAIYIGDVRNGGTPPAGVTNPNAALTSLDGWNSNMIIMNGQGYTVGAGDISAGNMLVASEFNFTVGSVRGRVTPFIAEVLSPTSFNVLAIGTTRISGIDYTATGVQNLAFDSSGNIDLSGSVTAGMVIAAGFLNSDADGTNTGNPGSVIPYQAGSVTAGDQWYNGNSAVDNYPAGAATAGSLAAAPAAGVNNRAYEFNLGLNVVPVPEPSSGLLAVVALSGLLFRRRR